MKNLIFTLMMICFVYGALGAKRIAFLENPTIPGSQAGLKKALTDKGYIVETSYTPFNFETLAGYDLVIVGRAVSSGDFSGNSESWNTLKNPVFLLSSWCARSTRLKFFNTTGAVGIADGSAGTVRSNLVSSAVPVGNGDGTFDAVFNGVTTGGSTFEYAKWFYDYLKYTPDSLVKNGNTGKPLVILAESDTLGAGTLAMVRWAPGTETYPGAGIHNNYRSFMNIGADDGTIYNYDNYTDASLQLFLNEVAFLLNTSTVGVQNLKSESQLKVYPMPAVNGRFTIEMKGSKSGTANVKIYTITGMQVYDKNFDSNGNISINSGLRKGIYLLVVNTNGNKSSQKILIN